MQTDQAYQMFILKTMEQLIVHTSENNAKIMQHYGFSMRGIESQIVTA